MTTQKDSAASEGVPERIWIPTSAATLMEVSPELQNVEGAWYVRESASSVDKAADASKEYVRELLDQIEASFTAASDERYQSLREWEQLANKWKDEGDTHGMNFHQGMAAGANWCDIYYRRIWREVQSIRALISQHQETK